MEKKKLERIRFRIKDENGNFIGAIPDVSMVTDPAIEKNFELFKEVELAPEKFEFKVSNEELMEVTGPIMVPDMDILRKNEKTGQYFYCYFTKEDVKDYAEWYIQKGNVDRTNFEHNQKNFTKDFNLIESWFVRNPEMDTANALGFNNIVSGEWFGTYRTTNSTAWAQFKERKLNGFSVEISLSEFKKQYSEEKFKTEVLSILNDEMLSDLGKEEKIKELIENL